MSKNYFYSSYAMDRFDEQGVGYADQAKLNEFIRIKDDEGWELVTIGGDFIVFRRLAEAQ